MAKPKRRRRGQDDDLARKRLVDLIAKHPQVLHVLDDHGVTFCAGCYITLSSPLRSVAGYHAVPDARQFLKDVRKAVSRRKT